MNSEVKIDDGIKIQQRHKLKIQKKKTEETQKQTEAQSEGTKKEENYLLEAFQTDCQTLIIRFELSKDTNFQSFCDIWRDMQFALVFTCHPSEIALMAFCKDALNIVKQFLINACGLKRRIAALFLMYGVYYKMPTKQLKIRMTISDWKCLMDLHQQIKTEEYLDSNYILCKLIVDCAFIHCISDNEYGIEKYFQKKQAKAPLDIDLVPEIKELAMPGQLLSTISNLSKKYKDKKRVLLGEEASSISLYDVSTADKMANSIRMMQSNKILAQVNLKEEVNSKEEASYSKRPMLVTLNNESDQKSQKRARLRKNRILAKIGRAFEKGLESESSEEEINIDL